jgi:hypothetical protein
MLKQVLAIVAGFTFAVAVFAADVELRDDHPDVYVVQKGDTLWDISGRFLSEPWLWPEIWQANPQIANPHLIYPGDRLTLVYVDGRARLMNNGNGEFGPRVRRTSLDDAITAIPLSRVLPFLEKYRVVDRDDAKGLPYVVALDENRVLATEGMRLYVRHLDAAPGTRVTVVRPTYEYWDVPDRRWRESPTRHTEVDTWRADHSQVAGTWATRWERSGWRSRKSEFLGSELMEIAQGEVLRGGDPATVLVHSADLEMMKGDLIVIGDPGPFDLTFHPRAPGNVPDNMRVMSMTYQEAVNTAGPHQVIALSRGARDGVENGQVYAIFHPGDVVDDRVGYADNDNRSIFNKRKDDVQLPEEYVGQVMIFRTFDKVSYGLIMRGIRPVKIGDRLDAPFAD